MIQSIDQKIRNQQGSRRTASKLIFDHSQFPLNLKADLLNRKRAPTDTHAVIIPDPELADLAQESNLNHPLAELLQSCADLLHVRAG